MTLSKMNCYINSSTDTSAATAPTTAESTSRDSAALNDTMPETAYSGGRPMPSRRLSSTAMLLGMFDFPDGAGDISSDQSGHSTRTTGSPIHADNTLESDGGPWTVDASVFPSALETAPASVLAFSAATPSFEETEAMIEARAAAATAARIAEEEEMRERAAHMRPTRKRKRKPRIAELDDDEKEEKRARNKLAAEKCRTKKKLEMESKFRHSIELEEENKELRQQLKGILDEVFYLRKLVSQRQLSGLAPQATSTMPPTTDLFGGGLDMSVLDEAAQAFGGDCFVPST